MTVEKPGNNTSFLALCRSNYFKDIRPADPALKKAPGYTEAVALAQGYFTAGRQSQFRSYLAESQYLVNLWAAHLILEYAQPDEALTLECLEVIGRHADSPFDALLAKQEQEWLSDYAKAVGSSRES